MAAIQRELEADGLVVKTITLTEGVVKIEGNYRKAKLNYSQYFVAKDGLTRSYTVKEGQTIFDIALVFYGSIEGVARVMELNNMVNLPPSLSEGMVILIDKSAGNIANLYTLISEGLATELKGLGIGEMMIGTSFKID